MTFNGSELKYFKNQYDKDRSSRNIVPLHEMIDIKKVHDVSVYLVVLPCRKATLTDVSSGSYTSSDIFVAK